MNIDDIKQSRLADGELEFISRFNRELDITVHFNERIQCNEIDLFDGDDLLLKFFNKNNFIIYSNYIHINWENYYCYKKYLKIPESYLPEYYQIIITNVNKPKVIGRVNLLKNENPFFIIQEIYRLYS